MGTRLVLAASVAALFSVRAADAQYRSLQYSYGGGNSGYSTGYGVGVHPAGRPSYQYGGPSPFVWYSPHEGYSYDYQNGLPWRKNTSTGPIGRGGDGGVVRYSRPPQEANEAFYVRTRASEGSAAKSPSKNVEPATAEQSDKGTAAPEKLPVDSATPRATASKRPARAPGYSAAAIRANGGGDWVPNVPSR